MLSNFFQIFISVSPVFILIILGNVLRRIGVLDVSFWEINDKLLYWVLIPALLFHFTSQIDISSSIIYSYVVVIISGILIVTIITFLISKLLGYSPQIWTSMLQGTARHNAFISLAIAGSLFGDEALEIGALFLLIYIPSANMLIISILTASLKSSAQTNAKGNIVNIFTEIAKNPFILAMVLGVLFSLIESDKLIIISETTDMLGSAALPILLLTIGAKIKVRDLTLQIMPIVISNSLKLIVLPISAFIVASFMGLGQLEITVAVIFASVPTAASSLSLAKQFGADSQLMTSIISTQVAMSFITIPAILTFITYL